MIPHFDHFPNRLVTAHEAGTQPLSFQCQTRACAPELSFARTVQKIVNPLVEPPADVWALGAAVCTHSVFILTTILTVNIRFTKFLPMMNFFYRCSMSYLPHGMVTMAGSLPPGWEDWYANLTDPPEISPTRADAWWVERSAETVQALMP